MSTVHTEYGPGRIIAQETVRGRTRFKVAGEGFEVWLDQTKLGGYEAPSEIDYDAPHWQGHHPDDTTSYPEPVAPLTDDEYAEYADPRGHLDRARLRTHPDYLDDSSEDARYARRRRQGGYAEDEMRGLTRGDYEGYDEGYDPADEYRGLARDPGLAFDDDQDARYARRRSLGKGDAHLAWAPLDDDNSTDLPYNPEPQHHAIGTPGDEGSSTIQPIHHIDADDRLRSSDSISFDEVDDDDEPGPNPDLFASRQAGWPSPNTAKGIGQSLLNTVGLGDKIDLHQLHDKARDKVRQKVVERTNNSELADKTVKGLDGGLEGGSAAGAIAAGEYAMGRGFDRLDPGYNSGWGNIIHQSSRHEASPAGLIGPALRVLGPMAINSLTNGGGGHESGPGVIDEMLSAGDPGSGWDGVIAEASRRPAGLSDKYIDLTASVDYWNDPVAQFRHDPDAYINRIGHLMDEGLNPRFAEYMDLVEADNSIRTAAWKDVRAKAMRLKTSGAVHVKDIAPSRIMASVDGDHGTYDVTILKGASYGDQSIANWHCGCEWGKWAFKRKFTYVGRLCSHAYASYLTMQSAALKDQARGKRPSRGPSDMVIVKRKQRDRYLPTFQMAAGLRTADALQNGPERLTPDMVVNDTDDAHMFLDVTKDERDDTGPDDVVSDKDIVHFARLMRHCEVSEQPYPRELVAFLSRYAGCTDDSGDDTQADYKAHDAADANEYLEKIRSDADRDQEDDFGDMADRVNAIQDAVEEARAHGVDADRFVATVRKMAAEDDGVPDGYKAVPGGAPGTQLYREIGDGKSVAEAWGFDRGNKGIEVGPNGNRQVKFDGGGSAGQEGNKFNYDGGAYGGPTGKTDPQAFADSFQGKPPAAKPAPSSPTGSSDPDAYKTLNDKGQAVPRGQAPQPAAGQQQQAPSGQATGQPAVGQQSYSQGKGGGETSPGADAAPGGGQTSGGQTSGNVSDGGVAGAENGNNAAITKTSPNVDANGMYTVQQGDTWTDIAQRTTGDMNNYQKMYDLNKGVAGPNVDDLAVGTQVNLKDFLNDVGNGGQAGNITNPAGGGADGDIATVDTPKGSSSGAETALNAGASIGTGVGEVNTDAAAGNATTPAAPAGGAATTDAVKPAEAPAVAPTPTAGSEAKASLRTARDWLRWAAEGDATNSTAPTTEQPDTATTTSSPASGPTASPTSRSAPATNPAQNTPGMPSKSETFDPASPAELEQQSTNSANPGAQAGGSNTGLALPGLGGGSGLGMDMSDIGGMISQGVGAATDIASGIGSAIPGLISGIGSIFASKEDFDSWARYAYPADGGDDFDPKTLPHIPFAGSGNPGPLEFSTSEEYADEARKKMDDVTDLGDGDLTTPMGEWQKQSRVAGSVYDDSYGDTNVECPACGEVNHDQDVEDGRCPTCGEYMHDHGKSAALSTDDDSDIVRTFQAHLGDTALGAGGGQGRFDDIAGAAQGFLRTAGRNYSLAEQSELIREGDKGGARNLDSLDLKGTHYEDMHTLGW